jgi:serine/threonine protein kinase
LHDIYESDDAVYIVTDLCTGGELFQRIIERGTYTEAMASDLVRQMLEGLAYLHSEGVKFSGFYSLISKKKKAYRFCFTKYRLFTEISSPKM